jgi:GTP pyrophosphokinase
MNQVEGKALIEKAGTYLPEDKVALVKAAYEFAAKAHQGQTRKTGEPYLEHPVNTAMILAELQLDAETLAAALLHDVPEDCGVSWGYEAEQACQSGSDGRNKIEGSGGKLTQDAFGYG